MANKNAKGILNRELKLLRRAEGVSSEVTLADQLMQNKDLRLQARVLRDSKIKKAMLSREKPR